MSTNPVNCFPWSDRLDLFLRKCHILKSNVSLSGFFSPQEKWFSNSLSMGYAQVTFSKKCRMGRGGKSILEKPDSRSYLEPGDQGQCERQCHVHSLDLCYGVLRRALAFLPKTHHPSLWGKKRDKQLRDIIQNTWPVLLDPVKVIKKGKAANQPRGPQGLNRGDSGWNCGAGKGCWGEQIGMKNGLGRAGASLWVR